MVGAAVVLCVCLCVSTVASVLLVDCMLVCNLDTSALFLFFFFSNHFVYL